MKQKILSIIFVLMLSIPCVFAEDDGSWWNPLDWGSKIMSSLKIPAIINQVFVAVRDFLQGIELVFLNIYVLIIVTLFFALISLLVYLPIKAYPLYKQNKQIIDKIIKLKF